MVRLRRGRRPPDAALARHRRAVRAASGTSARSRSTPCASPGPTRTPPTTGGCFADLEAELGALRRAAGPRPSPAAGPAVPPPATPAGAAGSRPVAREQRGPRVPAGRLVREEPLQHPSYDVRVGVPASGPAARPRRAGAAASRRSPSPRSPSGSETPYGVPAPRRPGRGCRATADSSPPQASSTCTTPALPAAALGVDGRLVARRRRRGARTGRRCGSPASPAPSRRRRRTGRRRRARRSRSSSTRARAAARPSPGRARRAGRRTPSATTGRGRHESRLTGQASRRPVRGAATRLPASLGSRHEQSAVRRRLAVRQRPAPHRPRGRFRRALRRLQPLHADGRPRRADGLGHRRARHPDPGRRRQGRRHAARARRHQQPDDRARTCTPSGLSYDLFTRTTTLQPPRGRAGDVPHRAPQRLHGRAHHEGRDLAVDGPHAARTATSRAPARSAATPRPAATSATTAATSSTPPT